MIELQTENSRYPVHSMLPRQFTRHSPQLVRDASLSTSGLSPLIETGLYFFHRQTARFPARHSRSSPPVHPRQNDPNTYVAQISCRLTETSQEITIFRWRHC